MQLESQRPDGVAHAHVVGRDRHVLTLVAEEDGRREMDRVECPDGSGEGLEGPGQDGTFEL